MQPQHGGELGADRLHRVEGGHRLLRDHGQLARQLAAPPAPAQAQEIAAEKAQTFGGDHRAGRLDAEHGESEAMLRPTKLRMASTMTAMPISRPSRPTSSGSRLGRISRPRIAPRPSPMVVAAVT